MSDPNMLQAAMAAQSAGRTPVPSPGMPNIGFGMQNTGGVSTMGALPAAAQASGLGGAATSGLDLKGPLSQFAVQMLLQKMNPQAQPMQAPPVQRMWG